MGTIATEAWVLYQGPEHAREPQPAELKKERFSFPDITEYEVLAEPIYGCWESNMTNALQRHPIDVCRQRQEEKVVIGNAGVVHILKVGSAVTSVKEGDFGIFTAIGSTDQFGYPLTVVGYDAPKTIGMLAKQTKLHERQVIAVPKETKHSLQQWAAFSLRYLSAWSNWQASYGCWCVQMPPDVFPHPFVWGWGGGVVLAELALAKHHGCQSAMIASNDERLALIEKIGITPIDRRHFPHLDFDEQRYRADPIYRKLYQESERTFLEIVKRETQGLGVSIFLDNIGSPVFRATLKAIGRQGVLSTQGWKKGMDLSVTRAIECINRHIHVHTHAGRYNDSIKAVQFAEKTGWMPPVVGETYDWEDIPQLAHEYAAGRINSYFPLFQVNPL